MASTAIALAQAASKIQTVGDLRAAMGAVTQTLAQGYSVMEGLTSIAGVQDAARSLLNTVNNSASLLYNKYPYAALDPGAYGPPQDLQSLSAWDAHLAGVVISEANDALKTVEQVAAQNLFDIAAIVIAAVAAAAALVGAVVQDITNAVVAGASAFVWAAWPTLLLVGGVAVAYLYRDRIAKSLGAKL